MCGMGGGSKNNAAEQQAAADRQREGRIEEGRARIDEAFAGFDDGFYDARRQAFTDNAAPQLDRQFDDARRRLIYALSDSGALRSNSAATRLADLERDYNDRRLQLASEAQADADSVRSDVEARRADLVRTLAASGDVSAAASGAANQAQAISAQPTFSPIAQVFQNVGSGIGVARNARDAAAVRDGTYGTRLFSSGGSGSGKLVA